MEEALWLKLKRSEWPYDDLVPRCWLCPWCGSIPSLVVSPAIHPMAWCRNDACELLMFDPSMTAKENLDKPTWHVVDSSENWPQPPT